MDNEYRLNLRFNLKKAEDKMIVDYLKKLSAKSRNQFIRDAILKQMHHKELSLEDIRAMFRDELKFVSIAVPTEAETPQDNQIVQNMLDDLRLFE